MAAATASKPMTTVTTVPLHALAATVIGIAYFWSRVPQFLRYCSAIFQCSGPVTCLPPPRGPGAQRRGTPGREHAGSGTRAIPRWTTGCPADLLPRPTQEAKWVRRGSGQARRWRRVPVSRRRRRARIPRSADRGRRNRRQSPVLGTRVRRIRQRDARVGPHGQSAAGSAHHEYRAAGHPIQPVNHSRPGHVLTIRIGLAGRAGALTAACQPHFVRRPAGLTEGGSR